MPKLEPLAKPEQEKKEKTSAFDPKGVNKVVYSPNSFDLDYLTSYSTQILEVAEKAHGLYRKKMKTKQQMDMLKSQLQTASISHTDFQEQSSRILKGHDEYKVYEIYDNYISYLVKQMKSLSDTIFNYVDKHHYDIPIVSQEEKEKFQIKKEEHAEGWAAKADEFAKKRIKKKSLFDTLASQLTGAFKKDEKQEVLSKESVTEQIDLKKKTLKRSNFIDKFVKEHKTKEDVVGGRTAFSERFKSVRRIHLEKDEELKQQDLGGDNQAKDFLEKLGKSEKKTAVTYKPESYSALANVLMKDFSLEFINSFPTFFKTLYKNLRHANINMLSSTYTNSMILSSIIGGVGVMFFVGFISVFSFLPLPMIVANAFLGGIMGIVGVFMAYNYYPKYKMKDRERNINTNLPFAIDHMAAVVSAGVSPNAMFQLISQSKEYGQVSIEIEKIVEYVELFGYDIMSAVEKVAAVSPSKQMKEFLEGFISTIESGGELKQFLRESADQTMLHYRLERQKFTESISTFSDIYTGLMVASPLFFVAALSMVSILGGTIGNMDVTTLMVIGTYVAIPLMNLLFVVFMELTQPTI
jgi:pilus assembly protein TadC